MDDLDEGNLLVLCVKANPEEGIEEHSLHVWRGSEFEPNEIDPQDFIQEVMQQYWGEGYDKFEIEKIEEIPG